MSIRVQISVAPKFGFATQQNSVPLIRELVIHNESEQNYDRLSLQLTSSPAVIETRQWNIDRLIANSSLDINDRIVTLDANWLAELTESVHCTLTLTLAQGDETLFSERYPLEALARNEWGGDAMAELLPAFIMPNDPSIDRLLKATAEVLRSAGKDDKLDGYEARSRTRVWEQASALWTAVCNLGISYALPPASFEHYGQKVRTPGAILDARVATCLDTSLLFASALEQLGLNPLIMLGEGHAFVGLWLQPQEFAQMMTEDVSAVRKRIDLKELIAFETTLATSAHPASFSQACEATLKHLNEDKFYAALDVRRARMQKIRPLTSVSRVDSAEDDTSDIVTHGFDVAPLLPGFDVDVEGAERQTLADRLTLWQRKLLDLTTRNRLLHLPESAKGIRLVCADPAALEDKLAEGKRIRIVPLPDLENGGRDAELYKQQTHEDLHADYAREALMRGEVVSPLERERLESLLIELYRKARSDLEEGGANTLFLAVGFLQWKKAADDPKCYSAPLILLPIQLDRKSALSGVTMRLLEEEPRFNLTLLELLQHDFGLTINGLDGELPNDESGIDVEGIWNQVRRAVRDMPGFEVTRGVVIGTFSFAKYLMWKDLVDRTPQLMQSELVRYLIERGQKQASLPEQGEFIEAEKLDDAINIAELFIPLPADSSQIAAVVASARGRDFVLDGPPGTGKSQTIANMIAHNLAMGRRVLFVAEKKAALDVVYRRLEAQGLGEFCLELHSSKTSKIDFLKQLDRAWEVKETLTADEWQEEATSVQRLRNRLNGVVKLLHKRWPNGLSLHQAMGRVIKEANDATPQFSWPAGHCHDAEQMAQFRDIARRLELNRAALASHQINFSAINQSDWTNGWQASLIAEAKLLPDAFSRVEKATDTLLTATGLSLDTREFSALRQWVSYCELMLKAWNQDLSVMFAPDAPARIAAVEKALALLDDINALTAQLSVTWPQESWQSVPVGETEKALAEADKKFWFLASMARKKVLTAVMHSASLGATPSLDADLKVISQLQSLQQNVAGHAAIFGEIAGWNGLHTDTVALGERLHLIDALRAALGSMAETPARLAALRETTRTLVIGANDMLSPDGQIASATRQLSEALRDADAAILRFCQLSQADPAQYAPERLLASAIEIVAHQSGLKAWCDWTRVRNEATDLGLSPLVDALPVAASLNISALDIFETAYCRWFATWVIDADPRLHNFVPVEHMSDIDAYRQQSDRLARLTVRYIRARLCGVIPSKNDIGKQGGFALLKHELQKQRRHKPVRQMANEMGDAMGLLAPCMLMSPLSVAQFLPAEQTPFDLVIFDEASQISPWDAIGAMARGKQVVIAGDPRQMPPTSFFNRAASDTDDDTEEDMESILDECLAAGLYNHSLSWHYRSRHESLITFSNHRYYDGNLITFPAAETRQSAVEWRKISGVYTKGKGRHNQAEAEAIVAETIKRLTDPQFVASGKSIGIITLNTEQQKLINDLLDKARQQHPQIEPFFNAEQEEPVVVKNLETVQGDERDLIMLGIGYGPTEPGANSMSMNFGPLNRDGGWRRLNVAVTRARQEMLVFSSFDPSMIDLNRTSARAVADLKHFIEFAQRGPVALAQAVRGSVGGYDSPFEEAVAQGLRRKGWQVVPQIGVSRFRIDLGIVHPDRSGDYLVGVECDGATYHSAATARDRDKVRSSILQGLGWTLVRLWSTEWWVDKASALERLHNEITRLLEASREAHAANAVIDAEKAAETPAEAAAEAGNANVIALPASELNHAERKTPPDAPVLAGPEAQRSAATKSPAQEPAASEATPPVARYALHDALQSAESSCPVTYSFTDISPLAARLNPERFYDADYDDVLYALIQAIVSQEAPLLDSSLVQRVARAHGFNRAGRLIRDRVLEMVDRHHHLAADPSGDSFVWLSESQRFNWNQYRLPATDDDIRQVDAIASEELRALAVAVPGNNTVAEIAKQLGIRRITAQARQRIESVL